MSTTATSSESGSPDDTKVESWIGRKLRSADDMHRFVSWLSAKKALELERNHAVFDIDGVCSDTYPAIAAAHQALNRPGVKLKDEDITDTSKLFQDDRFWPKEKQEGYKMLNNDIYKPGFLANLEPMPGVASALPLLSQISRLWALTARTQNLAWETLAWADKHAPELEDIVFVGGKTYFEGVGRKTQRYRKALFINGDKLSPGNYAAKRERAVSICSAYASSTREHYPPFVQVVEDLEDVEGGCDIGGTFYDDSPSNIAEALKECPNTLSMLYGSCPRNSDALHPKVFEAVRSTRIRGMDEAVQLEFALLLSKNRDTLLQGSLSESQLDEVCLDVWPTGSDGEFYVVTELNAIKAQTIRAKLETLANARKTAVAEARASGTAVAEV